MFSAAFAQSSLQQQMQEGLRLFNSGDVAGAASIFDEIVKQQPNHGPAQLMLGQIALERGESQQAQEHLKVAVEAHPQRIQLAWQLLGKTYLLQHQYEQARDSFEQALKEAPNFSPAIVSRARANLFLNQIQPAIEDLQKVSEPEAKVLLAEVFLFQNNKAQAEQIFSTMNEDVNARLFQLAFKSDAASEKQLKMLIGQNLGLAETYFAAAVHFNSDDLMRIAYSIDDQNPVAQLFLQRSKAQIPKFNLSRPKVVQMMFAASEALSEKKLEEAERLSKEIQADRPLHIPALLINIESAEKQNKNWDALSLYERITTPLSETPAISTRLALLARDMQANDAAECSIKKSIEVQPDDASLHYIYATILKQQAKTDEAIAECKRAIELGFQEAAAYVTLGDLYYEQMEIPRAIEALQSAIQKDPEAAEDIASFALAVLTSSNTVQLREILEKHTADHPENINTLYSLGILYLNQNEFGKAKDYFLKVEKLAPKNSQVFYNLSLIYQREGQAAEAEKAMQRFEQLKTEERQEWLRRNQAFRIRQEAIEAENQGNSAHAIQLYSQIVEQGTAEKEDLLALAKNYLKANDYAKSVSFYQKVLNEFPYETEAMKGLIQSAEKSNKTEEAKTYRNKLELLSSICKKT
jgi:tetratricopeptide (TPR) repeat protein